MKNLKTRILSMLLILVILASSLVIPSVAAEATDLQYNYSKEYNSGKRHEVCTTLNGTSAEDYYTGSYQYDLLSEQSASEVKDLLHALMTETHHTKTTYANCRDKAIYTDCELEANKGVTDTTKQTVVLLYTSYTATRSQYYLNNNGWNREHVWPQSLGGGQVSDSLGESKGGSDLHHVRPADGGVNSTRNNNQYGNVSGGKQINGTGKPASTNILAGWLGGGYYEPADNVKGDVARICLYVWVRWGSEWKADEITQVFQSVDVLLEWMELDPVDTWEMGRNEVVEKIQGNRNVFIDYPEYAWLIFGREIPTDMVTPSGEAKVSAGDPTCPHTSTVVKNASAATCTSSGYTGDTRCATCNMLIIAGTVIPANGHGETTVENAKDPTCTATGYTGDKYCNVCGQKAESGSSIPANGHGETTLKDVKEPTCTAAGHTGNTYCNICGQKVTSGSSIPANGHKNDRVENKVDPTCTAGGYSGDTYCSVCNVKTITGTALSALGHSWSEWIEDTDTLTKTRICATCGGSETVAIEAPECPHENAEMRNEKAATCGASGYTGDTYCKDCDEKLESGEVILATDTHSYGEPVITVTPTPTQNGEMTCTCTVCGNTKTEVIEYVPDPDEDPSDDPIDTPVTPPSVEDNFWGASSSTEEELVVAIISKNALYAFLVDWLTRG